MNNTWMATVGILTALVTAMRRDKYKIICLKTIHSLQHGITSLLPQVSASMPVMGAAKDREVNILITEFRMTQAGLSWWYSGQESACQCRGHRIDPWSGRIPHATEQLSLCATTTEPTLQSPGATTTEASAPYSPCSITRNHHNEKPGHLHKEQPPLTTTRGNLCTARKTQRTKYKIIFF